MSTLKKAAPACTTPVEGVTPFTVNSPLWGNRDVNFKDLHNGYSTMSIAQLRLAISRGLGFNSPYSLRMYVEPIIDQIPQAKMVEVHTRHQVEDGYYIYSFYIKGLCPKDVENIVYDKRAFARWEGETFVFGYTW